MPSSNAAARWRVEGDLGTNRRPGAADLGTTLRRVSEVSRGLLPSPAPVLGLQEISPKHPKRDEEAQSGPE